MNLDILQRIAAGVASEYSQWDLNPPESKMTEKRYYPTIEYAFYYFG